ncbi:hypothetical protein [Paenibacillus kobensis]|uniref:hypothetical protein n=1 Tax=Paenibacillus kobensis TaxID=59841 RepID=UPI000FD6D5E7|nr:hypothetical protein [Paenibacillus kobensis]
MAVPIQDTIALLAHLLSASALLPMIMFLISIPVILTGSISALSVTGIAVYASLFILSYAIGMRTMTRESRTIAMVIPTVLVADGAAMLAGMNWYGHGAVILHFLTN